MPIHILCCTDTITLCVMHLLYTLGAILCQAERTQEGKARQLRATFHSISKELLKICFRTLALPTNETDDCQVQFKWQALPEVKFSKVTLLIPSKVRTHTSMHTLYIHKLFHFSSSLLSLPILLYMCSDPFPPYSLFPPFILLIIFSSLPLPSDWHN